MVLREAGLELRSQARALLEECLDLEALRDDRGVPGGRSESQLEAAVRRQLGPRDES
jgi:hypothetical protein